MPDRLDQIADEMNSGGDRLDQLFPQQGTTSATGTLLEHAAVGIGPGAAFALAAPKGIKIGAKIGAATGEVLGLGPEDPAADAAAGVLGTVGAFLGGLISGGIASWGAYKVQHAAIKAASPKFAEEMDKKLAAGSEQHPFAAVAGDVISMLPSAEASIPKLSQVPFRAALGASVGAVQPLLLQGQKPTKEDVVSGALMASVFGRGRFERKPVSKIPPGVTPAPGAASQAEPKAIVQPMEGGYHQVHDKDGNVVLETQNPAEAQAKADELNGVASEDQKVIDAGREVTGFKIDVVDPETMPEDQPFAKRLKRQLGQPGQIATIDRSYKDPNTGETVGRILFNRKQLQEHLSRLPQDQQAAAIKSLVQHEDFHLKTSDEDAKAYWNSLWSPEQSIERWRYTGNRKGLAGKAGEDDGILMGHEALRYRMQQLSNMKPSEFFDPSFQGKNKWSLKSIDALEKIIRGMREKFTDSDSRRIADRMLANLNIARVAAATSSPAAKSRDDENLPKLQEGERWVTVRKPDGTTYPATFSDKYYDYPKRGKVASVGKLVNGGISHGMLAPGETIEERPPSDARQQHLDALKESAAQYRASGDEQSAREIEESAKWFAQRTGEKSFPAARSRFRIRPLTDEEKAALPPVKPEDRQIVLPPIPNAELNQPSLLPASEGKGKGPIKMPSSMSSNPARGEYRKRVLDKVSGFLGLNTGYFRPSGSADKPVAEGDRVTATEASGFKYPTATELETRTGQWLDSEIQKVGTTVEKAGHKTVKGLPKIKDLELELNVMAGGRLQEGAAFDMAQRLINDRLQKASGEQLTKMYQQEVDRRHRKGSNAASRAVMPVADAPTADESKLPAVQKGLPGIEKDVFVEPKRAYATGTKSRRPEAHIPGQQELSLPAEIPEAVATLPAKWRTDLAELNKRIQDGTATTDDRLRLAEIQNQINRIKSKEPLREAPVSTQRTQDTALVRARQARRQKVIGYLMDRMTRRPLAEIKTSLERTSIKPEDIRYGTEWRYPGADHTAAWAAFSPEDEKTPQVLGHKLVDEASVSGDLPKTVTRRVTALMNRATGKVSLVSTYAERGRDETRLLDPDSGAARRHSSLPTILKRYRVLYSALLDQPVQNFRQDYSDLPDFMEKFGKEASDADAATRSYQEPPPVEGTPGMHGEGGGFMGPGRELVSETGEGENEISERTPMTSQEALALNGQIAGAENVDQAVKALKDLRSKPNHSAISALVKMSGKLQADNPDLDAQALLRLAATRILQARERSKTPADFVKSLSVESSTPAARMRRNDPNQRKLGDIATADVQRPGDDEESMPQARMRFALVQQKVEDVSSKIGDGLRSGYVKKGRNEAIVASLDAADDGAVNARVQAAQAVRARATDEKTGKVEPQILSAANAFLASGAIKADYKMNLAQQHGAEKLKLESKAYQEGRRLMQSKNPQDVVNGMKMASEAMSSDVHKVLLEEGIINHDGATYGFDEAAKDRLDEFLFRVKTGMDKADAMIKNGGWSERRQGRAWKRAAEKLKSELEFAKAQWNNPMLRDTALQMRKEFDNQFDFEVAKGFSLKYDENYNAGRYDGEYFTDDGVWFHGRRVLGGQWRAPKMFQTYYHAIEQGSYLPLTRDGSAIVGNRVGQGMRKIDRMDWLAGLEDYKDPVSGKPMVRSPKFDQATGVYLPPDADYELVHPFGSKKPIAVLAGADARLMENITAPSWFDRNTTAANYLAVSQYMKHTVLLGDFFHLARVGYYAGAISGAKARMVPAWAALHIRESDIPYSVKKGIISQKTADYLLEKLPFNNGGRPQVVSRVRLAKMFSQAGFNVNRIQDALYKDLVRNIPIIGDYNKFLFDKLTPGLMMDSAINEFQRISRATPDADSAVVMRKIAKDLNYFFGSIGRQGWVKSATAQDGWRLVGLAPQWFEGLVKKEVSPARWLMSGGTQHATATRAMVRGLAAMFVLTQVVNLITRKKPTWENEEKDHKWDADFGGVWVSPLSVFNELTHDILRLSETKPKVWDAIKQVGENKLGFYGRVGIVLATDRSPSGEYITTTPGILKSAAGQLLPVPISFGKVAQAAGSFLTHGRVPPLEPGQLQRQVMSTFGIKGQVARQSIDSIQHQATVFAQQHGFQPDVVELQATDQPSYSKLRHAIFIGDQHGAQALMQQLLKSHTPAQITRAMSMWARRPFTGSRKAEHLFVNSLDDDGRDLYTKAQQQRAGIYQQYVGFLESNER
jgi:hypothetical protein